MIKYIFTKEYKNKNEKKRIIMYCENKFDAEQMRVSLERSDSNIEEVTMKRQ